MVIQKHRNGIELFNHQSNGVGIEQRADDGFINGTAMCVAHAKRINDWLDTVPTLELFIALAEDIGVSVNYASVGNLNGVRLSATWYVKQFPELITAKRGSPENGGGTWLHPDLAIQLAQWCNKPFAIQVSRWVRGWMVYLTEKPRKQWEKNRLIGKVTRCKLTDAIADYLTRYPELSDNAKRWIYKNTSDHALLCLFGRQAKKLATDLNADPTNLRDSFTDEELKFLEALEDLTSRLIDGYDVHPLEAIKQASERMLLPVQERALINQG